MFKLWHSMSRAYHPSANGLACLHACVHVFAHACARTAAVLAEELRRCEATVAEVDSRRAEAEAALAAATQRVRAGGVADSGHVGGSTGWTRVMHAAASAAALWMPVQRHSNKSSRDAPSPPGPPSPTPTHTLLCAVAAAMSSKPHSI